MNRRSFLYLALASSAWREIHALGQVGGTQTPWFFDITAKSGVAFKHEASLTSEKYLPESMGAGVAMFDYDNDGYLDLFFVNGALFRIRCQRAQRPTSRDRASGTGSIATTATAPLPTSPRKQDCRARLRHGCRYRRLRQRWQCRSLVTNFGGNTLYHNNGDGTFTDVTAKAGVGGSGWCTGACFVDYDRDGRLDLIVARYLDWDFATTPSAGCTSPAIATTAIPTSSSRFRISFSTTMAMELSPTFRKQSGIAASPGKGLGIAVNDFDRDGWPDIFVANDSLPEQLFRNNRNGTFSEVGFSAGLAYDQNGRVFAGMGVDFADYNNDGWPGRFRECTGKSEVCVVSQRPRHLRRRHRLQRHRRHHHAALGMGRQVYRL